MASNDVMRAMAMAETTTADVFGAAVDRRRFLRLAGVAGAAAMTGGMLKALPAGAAASAFYRATTNVNLRKKANTSSQIMLVIPAGAVVKDRGVAKNGFYKVRYGGHIGWAWGEYLVSTNPDASPNFIGVAVTTSNVNFREGPGSTSAVKFVVPKGTTVEMSDKVYDGYRYVRLNGSGGWIYELYLEYPNGQGGTGTPMKTTSNLNLREAPNTGAKVILVIPNGALVTGYDHIENGFRWVTYGGKSGWAYDAYLV